MIFVCPWCDLDRHVAALSASHVVSLLGTEGRADTPLGIERDNHLHLSFDDIDWPIPGYVPPEAEHVEALFAFDDAWRASGPLIVHCFAGISRSTAAALSLLARRHPGREAELARLLRQRAPHAQPNRRIVALADRLLHCDGRLVAAVRDMGPADFGHEDRLIELPVAFE